MQSESDLNNLKNPYTEKIKRLIERVPASCITKWARVQVNVAEAVVEAYASGDSNKMNTAYNWWLSMHNFSAASWQEQREGKAKHRHPCRTVRSMGE